MKKYILTIIMIIGASGSLFGQSTDYIYLGDNRPSIPGEQMNSVFFAENPARAAEAVHNSISYSQLLFPGKDNANGEYGGQFFVLTVPHFSLINISQQNRFLNSQATEQSINKELLGLQLGMSVNDFIPFDGFENCWGLGLYKMKDSDTLTGGLISESVNLDVGTSLNLYSIDLELLVKNLLVLKDGASEIFGPSYDFIFRIQGKIILDIEYVIHLSSANNYILPGGEGDIDFIGGLSFLRYFFANSLRTGMGLKLFFDNENTATGIPVIKYDLVVSYSPFINIINADIQYLENAPGFYKAIGGVAELLFENLSFSFGTEMMINNTTGYQSFVPMIMVGFTKLY